MKKSDIRKKMQKLGYTFCGSHVMMGGYEFKDVYVKYDKTGVVASLEGLIYEKDLLSLFSKRQDKIELESMKGIPREQFNKAWDSRVERLREKA
jgi:hypothetical protein